MNSLRTFYHFLGSIRFAIFLITAAAIFVIVGTLLESWADSHQFAAQIIYSNPIFQLLLWGFFINILISALRRWPFRWKHVPFLITHLGLLMILGGALLKSYFGIQGRMTIAEGTASQRVFLSNTYALHVEAQDPLHPLQTVAYQIPLHSLQPGPPVQEERLGMQIDFLRSTAHTVELQETWIKEDKGEIAGLPAFPIGVPQKMRIDGSEWNVIALRSPDPEEEAQKLYLNHLKLLIKHDPSGEILYNGPFRPVIDLPNGSAQCSLQWNFSLISGFDPPPGAAYRHQARLR